MISVTSVTDNYILQPALINKHKKTLEWLSAAVLWKRELGFFQKLLDQYAPKVTGIQDKKAIDHFQNIILYYKGELIDAHTARLRLHEKKLAEILESRDETNTEYFTEHDGLMNELETLSAQMNNYKEQFFDFIEKKMRDVQL